MKTDARKRCTRAATSGQVWSLDFTVAFILFIVALLIAASFFFRTLLSEDTFVEFSRSADALSEQLMGTGYPQFWRVHDVVTVGLLTDNELSMRKAERLAQLVANDYWLAKDRLNTKYEYAIVFTDRNGTIVPIGTNCRIGSADAHEEGKVNFTFNKSIAYYYRSGGGAMNATLTPLHPSVFVDDDFSRLLGNLSAFDLVVLEEPRLAEIAHPYDAGKASLLEEYVYQGGTLLLIGDVNLSEAFSLNLTPLNLTTASTNASGMSANDSFLDFSGLVIAAIPNASYAFSPTGQDAPVRLATLGSRDFAAAFRYGDGDVYYLGGLNGTVNPGSLALATYVAQRINATAQVETASCTNVSLPTDDIEHLITVQRLVASEGRILVMEVTSWSS
jgi:hypothetical protein